MTRLGSKLIALLAVGLGWTACSSDLAPEQQPQGGAVLVVDATQGRKTRSVIVTDGRQIVLSALLPETILARAAGRQEEGPQDIQT